MDRGSQSTQLKGGQALYDRIGRVLGEWKNQRPDLDAPIQRIRARLVLLGAMIARDNHLVAQTHGINGSEMRILYALRRSGPPFQLRPTDLQNALLVPSPTVTRQLDRLEQLGLVERKPDARDRRVYGVALTEPGFEIADAALSEGVNASTLSGALRRLSDEDRNALDQLLESLLRQHG